MNSNRRFVTNNIALERGSVSTDDDKFIRIKGYACHFNSPNHNGEVVTEESFNNELIDSMKENGMMPSLNIHHGMDIVGVWDNLTSDDKGIIAEGRVFKSAVICGVPVQDLIESGAVACLSTEGWTNGWWDEENEIWHAEKFYLTAISLVSLPADFGASVETSENKLILERKQARRATNDTSVDDSTQTTINRGFSALFV